MVNLPYLLSLPTGDVSIKSVIYRLAKTCSYVFLLFSILALNSCVEDPTVPILTTIPITNLSINSITSGGIITDDGGAAITAKGVCWGIVANPSVEGSHTMDGIGSASFASTITDLTPNTMYYVKAYAINEAGTAYGNDVIIATDAALAVLSTRVVTDITNNVANSGGIITYDGDATITSRGVCWSTSPNPDISDSFTTNGTGSENFVSIITGLNSSTTYFVRAYVINRAGVAYGEELSFRTKLGDIEGNLYETVNIGTQVWMTENLRTTKYNNNTTIPNIIENNAWQALTGPGYCWFDNDIKYKATFGALYSWQTINEGALCPTGWHVPTDGEFNILEIYLGIPADQVDFWGWRGTDQGKKMKSILGWENGGNGTNTSGFNGLSGGYRQATFGDFYALGVLTYWWTSTDDSANGKSDVAWYRRLDATNNDIYKATTLKRGGKYVRCIKN